MHFSSQKHYLKTWTLSKVNLTFFTWPLQIKAPKSKVKRPNKSADRYQAKYSNEKKGGKREKKAKNASQSERP